MNDTILADAAMSGAQPRFAPEALAAIVRVRASACMHMSVLGRCAHILLIPPHSFVV